MYDVPNEAEDIIKNHKRDVPARSLINQKAGPVFSAKGVRGEQSLGGSIKVRTVKAKEYLGLDTLGRQRENLQCT